MRLGRPTRRISRWGRDPKPAFRGTCPLDIPFASWRRAEECAGSGDSALLKEDERGPVAMSVRLGRQADFGPAPLRYPIVGGVDLSARTG